MCPSAFGSSTKYAWMDHDTALVNEAPPVQNTWYTVLDVDDVRLLCCAVMATDLLAAGSLLEVRWTLDGNVYTSAFSNNSGEQLYIYRTKYAVAEGGTLDNVNVPALPFLKMLDKRALHAKIEVRKTSVCLATDILQVWCAYETLEAT